MTIVRYMIHATGKSNIMNMFDVKRQQNATSRNGLQRHGYTKKLILQDHVEGCWEMMTVDGSKLYQDRKASSDALNTNLGYKSKGMNTEDAMDKRR